MNFRKRHIMYLLIGFVILLIPLTWYGAYGNAKNMIIAGGDQSLINIKEDFNIKNLLFSWNNKWFLGRRIILEMMQFPSFLLTFALSGADLSVSLINKCFHVFSFILMCFSIGIYLWAVNLSARKTILFFLTGGFFYLFNPYVALALPSPAVIFAYCGLSLILAVLERESQGFRNILRKALLINLILFICISAFRNLCYIGIYFMVIGLYTVLKFMFSNSKLAFLKKNTILLILALAFFSVIHIFWYSEYYTFYKGLYKVHMPKVAGKTSSEREISLKEKLKRLREIHANEGQTVEAIIGHRSIAYDKDRLKGIYRVEFYSSKPVKACSLFLVFVAFSSLFLCKKDKNIIIFSLIALLASFLGKGTSPPFAVIFRNLFKYFPGFLIYRNPDKFFLAYNFATSFLMAASVNKLYLKFKSEKKITSKKLFSISVIFLSIICLFIVSQPFWNGKLLYHDMKRATMKPFLCKLPQYWINMRNYINKTPDFSKSRIFVIPDTGYGRNLEWKVGYGGVDVSRYLLDAGVVNKPMGNYTINKNWNKHLAYFLFDSLTRNESPHIKNIFNFVGISHILLQNDLKKICSMEKPEKYIEILKHQKGIGEEKKFGKLTLYNAGTAFENINIADELCCISGGYEGLLALANFGKLTDRRALLFPEQNSVETNKLLLPGIDKLILVNSSFKDVFLNMVKSDGIVKILTPMPEVNAENYQEKWVLRSRFSDDGLLDISGFNYMGKIGAFPFCCSLVRSPYLYFTKSNDTLKFSCNVETQDEYYIFARAGCFPEAADIKLKFANTIKKVSLRNSSLYGFRWVNLGKFNFTQGANQVQLMGNSGKIVISEFLLVKVSQYERIMKNILNMLSENEIVCEYYFSNTVFGTELSPVKTSFFIPDDNKYLIRLFPNERESKEVLVDGERYEIPISGKEIYFAEGIHKIISPNGGMISISQIPEKNEKLAIISNNITYLKNTPTKRILNISTDLSTEILYFNETFDKGWQARVDGIMAKKHFVINGFANGYLFDKIAPGEHKVELEFLPQRGHIFRLWISGISVLIAIIVLFLISTKKFKGSRH